MKIQQTSNQQQSFAATASVINPGQAYTPVQREVFHLIVDLRERLSREVPTNISKEVRGAASRKQFQLGTDLVTFLNSPTFKRIKIEDATKSNVTEIFAGEGTPRTEGAFDEVAGMIDRLG